VLIARLRNVYKKAVIGPESSIIPRSSTPLSFFFEKTEADWCDNRFKAFTWINSVGKHDEARLGWRPTLAGSFSFFLISCSYLIFTRSFLLTFAYTEVQETMNEFADVHATYEKFLNLLHSDLDALEARDKAASQNSSFNGNNNNMTTTITTMQTAQTQTATQSVTSGTALRRTRGWRIRPSIRSHPTRKLQSQQNCRNGGRSLG
jgi:cleavage stimulation factor subunit 3